MCFKKTLFLLPATLLMLAINPAMAQTLTVGPPGQGCEHNTIQDAVNAAPPSGAVIRVRSGPGSFNEALLITNKTLEIIGGHSDCTTTVPTGSTTINASSGSQSVISFIPTPAGGGAQTLTLKNLLLTGGTGNALTVGGGITVAAGAGVQANLNLDNVDIGLNVGQRGGGIALLQPGSALPGNVTIRNSSISANRADGPDPHGGGLYCSGAHTITKVGGEINGNRAGVTSDNPSARGGGIYLDGCALNWFAHHTGSGSARLHSNISRGGGGGLYATGGAEATLFGHHVPLVLPVPPTSSRALTVSANTARGTGTDGRGAGVWADGADVTLHAVWLLENVNENGNGGGLAATDGAQVLVDRLANEISCHTPLECSLIRNNHAGDTGGAVYVQGTDTLIEIRDTVIRDNAAVVGSSAEVFLSQDGRINLVGSLLYRKAGDSGTPDDPQGPPNYTFWLSNGSVLNMVHTTVADTRPNSAVFRMGSSSAVVNLRSSIIHEQSGTDMTFTGGTAPLIDTDCMIWHSDALAAIGLPTSHSRNQVADPLFINRDNGNFQLQPDSPAVDYCSSSIPPIATPPHDLLGRPRGIVTKESTLHGPWDLGAFEAQPDVLFSDRFED